MSRASIIDGKAIAEALRRDVAVAAGAAARVKRLKIVGGAGALAAALEKIVAIR